MVAKRRAEDEHLASLSQAWRIATLAASAWLGKLPPLEELITRTMRAQGQQTADQQLARLEALGAHIGLSLKPMSESTKRALLRLRES